MNKDITKVIEKLGLLPVIPLSGYDKKPYVAWSIEQNIITDINSVNSVLANNTYTYTTKEGGTKILNNITGLALLTGTRSNIVVIDLDTHDINSNGIKSFEEYVQQNNISNVYDTFTVDTPTGGKHLYYKYSGDISSSAGILQGVDVRANGGLIVLPYTERKVNEEILQYKVVKDIPIMELPHELVELCTSNNTINSDGTPKGTKLDLIEIWNNGIPNGERNDKLLRVGGRLRKNFNNIEDFALCMLALNNNICVPPLNNDELDNICTYLWNRHINNSSNNYPYPYYYDEKKCAIFKKDDTKEDEEGENTPATLVYKGYLNLVGRRINIDTDEKGYVIESKDLQDYNKLILSGEELFGSNAERDIKNIFARTKGFVNLPVGQGSSKPVLKLLYEQDIHKRKNNLMVDTYYTEKIGWVKYNNTKLFSYPTKDTVLDTVECNMEGNTVSNSFTCSGTTQDWIDNVMPLLLSSNNGKVMLLGSFGAPLVNLLDIHENSIIQLEGATSTGKTHCLQGCASVYGNDKYIKQWNGTPYAINTIFSSYGSFPIIFDDLKNINSKVKNELGNICYGFVQGESKLQGKSDGGLRKTFNFSSLLLTSSEYAITDDLKQHEGATARVLVLPGSFLPVNETNREIVNKLDTNSRKYYGEIGLDWCKYLIELKNNNKVEEYKELYETYREILQSSTTNNILSRKCNTIALLQVTGYLLEDFLGKDYFNMDKCINELMAQIEETTKEADINTNAFLDVVEQLKLKVTDENDIYYKGTCIGSYRYNYTYDNKYYGEVLIVQGTILKDIIKELGYNASTTIRAWGDKGYTVKDNKNKNSVQNKINGKNVRTTVLVLSYYKELTNSGADLTLVPKNRTATDVF